jgi:hypothetical protein
MGNVMNLMLDVVKTYRGPNSEVWVENQAALSQVKMLLHLPNVITNRVVQIGERKWKIQNSLIL